MRQGDLTLSLKLYLSYSKQTTNFHSVLLKHYNAYFALWFKYLQDFTDFMITYSSARSKYVVVCTGYTHLMVDKRPAFNMRPYKCNSLRFTKTTKHFARTLCFSSSSINQYRTYQDPTLNDVLFTWQPC